MFQKIRRKITAVLLIFAMISSMLLVMSQEVGAQSGEAVLTLSTSTTHVFSSVTEKYVEQPLHQVNLSNTGNISTGALTVTLGGADPEAFWLSKASISDIAAGGSDYFQMRPVTELTAKTYTATVTVSGDGVEAKSFDVSFLVSPAGTTYNVTVMTYINNVLSDVGEVQLWRNNSLAAEAVKDEAKPGVYTAAAANGDYWVYINGVDTGRSIMINGAPSSVEVDYYSVSFSAINAGTTSESSIVATANGASIESGSLVLKNTSVVITAKGKGAASYTYAWNDSASTTAATLNIASLKGTLDVACTVTGVGAPPTEPDYDINGEGYLWTGSSEKLILSGDSDTLTVHKSPEDYIQLEIASKDGATVTINGNSIAFNEMNIVVSNDITLNLDNVNVTAPAVSVNPDALARNALVLNKVEKDSVPMTIKVTGECSFNGSEAGHGIASIQDQNIRITGTGKLNARGGNRTSGNGDGGTGILVNTYTYGTETGARLTIDGGIEVNAIGGNSQGYAGGPGIDVAWGDLTISNATVSAIGGVSTGTSSGGTAIRVSYGAPNPLKGGSVTIQDSTVTARGGISDVGGGRGIDAFGAMSINGSSTVEAHGGNGTSGAGGLALYAYQGEFNISGGTISATGGNSTSGAGGSAIAAYMKELNISGGTVSAKGGNSTSGVGGTAVQANQGELNITGGTVSATGGNGNTNSSLGLYSYYTDINLTGGNITAAGGNGAVNGSHAIYTHCGAVNIGSGASVTAIAGNGTSGVGGVGIRAYGETGGSSSAPGTVQIAANAGDVYVRGGQGATAQRDSIMGRAIYVSTGNIGTISMEAGAPHTIQNVPGGDELYLVKANVLPAAKVVIKSSVVGSKGSYLYRAPAKEDGLASLWLPEGEKTLAADGYNSGTLTVPAGGSPVPEITLNPGAVVTAHNTEELKTYMAASYVTTINLVEGVSYDYDGGSVSRALTINGNGAVINAGTGIDGVVVKMTDGKVPAATGKVFLEVNGAGSSLTLTDVTIVGGSTLFLCGINAKTGASVSLEGVRFKGFHANHSDSGTVNNFGVHSEPEALALTVKNCEFDSTNAFRNSVAVRGGTALIENSTFTGTATPELLNVSDGYEYGIYLYGGNSTIRNNTMSGYDGALIPGYLSSPIATAAYYDIVASITGNTLKDSTVGINLVGAWHTLSYPCGIEVNGIPLDTSENAYLLGEVLTSANTIANNLEGSIQLNLDQNDYYTDTTTTPQEDYGTAAYFGGFLKLKDKNSSTATLEFLASKTAKAAIANQKAFILQVSEDNGANWTTAAVKAPLAGNSTGAAVSLASEKTYLLRAVITITSMTMPHDSLPDVYTPADIVCYSNAVSVKLDSPPDSPSGSGSSSNTNADPGVSVIVNGKTQTAGTAETKKSSDGRTTTTVTVDSKKLETILATEEKGATVVIPVSGMAATATGKLTGEMVKNMETQDATLILKTDTASYTLPASQINISDVSRQLGAEVSLKDIYVAVSVAEPDKEMAKVVDNSAVAGGYTIMVPAVDFNITCTYGGRTVNVSSFNSYVERTIAIPDGVDPTRITTGVVVDSTGKVRHVPTRVTVINGKYYAVINSLTNSTYSVVWHPLEFADAASHWAKEAINDMGSRMVVSGVDSGLYQPDRDITRGEFAAIIVKALGLEPGKGSNNFTDVSSSAWYCEYIKTAGEYGIITGYGSGRFGPNDKITREQAMTMIAKAMKLTDLEAGITSADISSLLAGFGDASKASSYAKESIAACVKLKIVSGRNGKLIAPKDNITRAEVAVMVRQLLKKSNLI